MAISTCQWTYGAWHMVHGTDRALGSESGPKLKHGQLLLDVCAFWSAP